MSDEVFGAITKSIMEMGDCISTACDSWILWGLSKGKRNTFNSFFIEPPHQSRMTSLDYAWEQMFLDDFVGWSLKET